MSLAVRIALLASSLLIAATLTLFFLVRNRIESSLVQREQVRLDRTIELAAHALRAVINRAASDIHITAGSPAISHAIESIGRSGGGERQASADWDEELASVFQSLLVANPTYSQVRLIGVEDDGREILRLERTPSGIVRVPQSELQHKGERPYFKGVLEHNPGAIYVSEIELNQERGKLQDPPQPVVRVGTSVSTKRNTVVGLIVINLNLQALLNRINSLSVDPLNLYMTTEKGDYLAAPGGKRTFAFEWGQHSRIQTDIPWLADEFRHGVPVGRTIRHDNLIAHTLVLSSGQDVPKKWVFVGIVDLKRALADFLGFRYWLLGIILALIAVGSLFAVLFARRITAPLRQLTVALKDVGEGNFDKDLKATAGSDSEISDLRSAFETMRTAIQNREQRLRDAQVRIQAIVENAVSSIITIDERGKMLHVNKAACTAFGYSAKEMEGQNVSMLMPSPYREEHDSYLRNYLSTGKAEIIGKGREVEGLRKDGTTFPIDLGVAEIMLESGRTYIGTVTDLSDIKALQRARIAKFEEALKLERLKGEFIATINHELRTPLTSIVGSLSLVAHERVGELPSKVKSMIDIAFTNGERLAKLVNDILDIEKLAAGKMNFDSQDLSVGPLLQEAVRANLAYGQRYAVGIELKPGVEGLRVHTDPDRISQVLSNLISNAVKYSPEGASVVLSAKRRGGMVRISVADHGPGIPCEFRDRVFLRFAQADSSDARRRGGTGLGLSITKSIVEALGGSIGFVTREGKGTTFYIDLPTQVASVQAIPA
jgi:PAS domain S-box-containing protein